MARGNPPLLSFNRGIISTKALARVDLDRTRLSAEIMTNWLPSTQGSMRIRPGTKYLGSSYNDTGAEYIEFAASVTDVALVELTNAKMRVWLPTNTDTGNFWETPAFTGCPDVLLSRPLVATTLALTDTGWSDASTGGFPVTNDPTADLLPTMTGPTVGDITISASTALQAAWKGADDISTNVDSWAANGQTGTWQVDFGLGNTQRVRQYSIQNIVTGVNSAPNAWTFERSTDGAAWTIEDTRSAQTGWAASEKRTFTLPGSDTGTVEAYRFWRFNISANNGGTNLHLGDVQFFDIVTLSGASFNAGMLTLNAGATGSLAKAAKQVVVDTGDQNTEHGLAISVRRGPVVARVGSTSGDDDYVRETELGTGYHNLAFTPTGNFHVTLQTAEQVNRIVDTVTISDSGTVELTGPWDADDLANLRYDQSADVIYVDCDGVRPQKIERRGTGRSWSVVDYAPNNGPFRAGIDTIKFDASQTYGNTTLGSDRPFFREGHVGALFRLTHQGQSGTWFLGAAGASTEVIEMTGFNDTGVVKQDTGTAGGNERQIRFRLSGTYTGRITVQRSFDGPDIGFHDADLSDTGTATIWVNDNDDNITVWYRALIKEGHYTSGAAKVEAFYFNGIRTGVVRVTGFNSNQSVDVEVLTRLADTGPADIWEEGRWSDQRGWPQAVALHEGRLAHATKANIDISVSDDYENFDDTVEGESAPISRTLGSGAVDKVNHLISLTRLVIGTAGSEISVRSSSIDEPLTPTNATAKPFSTQGSKSIRAVPLDSRAVYIQRSGKRVYATSFGTSAETFGDYESRDLTALVPELLKAGVVSVAVQRQPDTRVHCVLENGKVAILTFEPAEEVLCWSLWQTDTGTGGTVERVAVLPGEDEDKVYYHIRRTINGATKRYLERWASETESMGDTGLSWLADCAASYTDTGRIDDIQNFDHLIAAKLVAWASDTGLTNGATGGKDLSPDVDGIQTRYTVDTGGNITAPHPVHHVVGGLPFVADYKSVKLAYAAEAGTALAQMKRVDKIALVMHQVHNNALFMGDDTGTGLDPLPRMIDGGTQVDADKIFTFFDQVAFPFKGKWDTDSRIYIRAKSPRPVTIMAAVPTVQTNERV